MAHLQFQFHINFVKILLYTENLLLYFFKVTYFRLQFSKHFEIKLPTNTIYGINKLLVFLNIIRNNNLTQHGFGNKLET